MSSSIIPISTKTPEVAVDIPLILRIAALLRHWGFPVCPDDGDGGYHQKSEYEYPIRAGLGLNIGLKRETIYQREIVTRTGFLGLKKVISHIEAKDVWIDPAGDIYGPLDDSAKEIVINCRGLEFISDLAKLAGMLQQELCLPCRVRLVNIGNVPLASEGQTLPLTDSQDATAVTLLQRVTKRLTTSSQTKENPDGSIELWSNGELKPSRLLVVETSHKDSQSVELTILLYASSLATILEEEIAGIEETLRFKGLHLISKVEKLY